MRRGAIGAVRRAVAGLLVLALLALSTAPVPAAPPPAHAGHAAAHGCARPGGTAVLAAAPSDHGRPDRRHHGTAPAPACCIASQCPMLLGALPVPPDRSAPPAGAIIPLTAPAHGCAGIDIPPALPPPRAA